VFMRSGAGLEGRMIASSAVVDCRVMFLSADSVFCRLVTGVGGTG
jgi:hypothetical protein